LKRSQGEGSIKEYKPGKWYARIRKDGKEYNFYGSSEAEVTEKLEAFKDTLKQKEPSLSGEDDSQSNCLAEMPPPTIGDSPSENVMSDVITVQEVQKILKIGKDAAYALVRSDDFPSFKIGGQYRVLSSQLNDWILEQISKKKERDKWK